MAILYTTAPQQYDYEAVTTQLSEEPYRNANDTHTRRPYRRVEVQDEHVAAQKGRYGSGLYPRLSEEQFREWIAYGLVVPLDTPVPAKRKTR